MNTDRSLFPPVALNKKIARIESPGFAAQAARRRQVVTFLPEARLNLFQRWRSDEAPGIDWRAPSVQPSYFPSFVFASSPEKKLGSSAARKMPERNPAPRRSCEIPERDPWEIARVHDDECEIGLPQNVVALSSFPLKNKESGACKNRQSG